MSIDRKNILLFIPDGASNDVPWLDYEGLGATEEERLYAVSNISKPDFDFKKYPFRFHWRLQTPFQEKTQEFRLRWRTRRWNIK